MRVLALAACAAMAVSGQTGIPDATALLGVKVETVDYKGRRAVRVVAMNEAAEGERLYLLKHDDFRDGSIELWMAGEPGAGAGAAARGFVGLAFRVRGKGEKYEAFYLRPTNGRVEDQVRRNHAAQYIAFPDYPWQRLRKEFPEKYESYVDLVPGEWTHVRITVKGRKACLYVHDAAQPTLVVNDLFLGDEGGALALWVGPGTLAHFAELRILP